MIKTKAGAMTNVMKTDPKFGNMQKDSKGLNKELWGHPNGSVCLRNYLTFKAYFGSCD